MYLKLGSNSVRIGGNIRCKHDTDKICALRAIFTGNLCSHIDTWHISVCLKCDWAPKRHQYADAQRLNINNMYVYVYTPWNDFFFCL